MPPPPEPSLTQTLANTTRHLLNARTPAAAHWTGHLASSPLSTATASFALALHDRAKNSTTHTPLISAGLSWLLAHQNPDGGWGDTPLSLSNISTTALCYAALSISPTPTPVGSDPSHHETPSPDAIALATSRAQHYLTTAAGSLQPAPLARAIADRYGKDRTFSVPILTMCALAGRLGPAPESWRLITQLPFEFAAFPQALFRFLKLPVVSYALPALISMGLARHRHAPSRNPFTRILRTLSTRRVLRVLKSIQPEGGGFLEATPLTSFVVMSLIGAARPDHPVVQAGVAFLRRSARPDGSWPIDTNLATWVTTLSINALAAGSTDPDAETAAVAHSLNVEDRARCRAWLLNQQYQQRHPYTGAPPGAWAWTDLPGGVPDADDTAGALIALHHLGEIDSRVTHAAQNAIEWLLNLQNRDGGIPTFCRGWTNLPFDRSGPDLTAHALHAWSLWRNRLDPELQQRLTRATRRATLYLATHQRRDGAWIPLWFGNQHAPNEENPTYGTAKVLIALAHQPDLAASPLVRRGADYLLATQNPDGGWGGAPACPSSIEETALALDALSAVAQTTTRHLPTDPDDDRPSAIHQATTAAANWLIAHTSEGTHFPPTPIGFYFAKLWYHERDYPAIYTLSALLRHAATIDLSN